MENEHKYWQDLVNKHLVGKYITKVEWLNPKDTKELLGWDFQPCELHLNDGTIITPSRDDEGNDAGVIAYVNEGVDAVLPVIDFDYEDKFLNKRRNNHE